MSGVWSLGIRAFGGGGLVSDYLKFVSGFGVGFGVWGIRFRVYGLGGFRGLGFPDFRVRDFGV